MKATVRLFKSDGKSFDSYPVKLTITHQGKTKRKVIGYSSTDDWDEFKNLPKPTHDDYEELYGQILDIEKKSITSRFKNLADVNKAMSFFNNVQDDRISCFYEFAYMQIERMRKAGRNGNADAYESAVSSLRDFRPSLNIADIDSVLLENFKQYKIDDGLKNTSIRTYLYEIRALYNKAVRQGLCDDTRPFIGLFVDLPVRIRRLKNRYLDYNGLEAFNSLLNDKITSSQRITVSLSMLQFYFCGADLVDIYYLKKKQISKGRVYFDSRAKLGVRGYEFDIKILPEAQKIIDEFMSNDSEYIFPWRKSDNGYKTFRRTHNRKLELLQNRYNIKLKPTDEKLTSKVMRHSFATLAKRHYIDPDIIRELMGHERNDIDTAYKDKFPEKERDEAQKLVCTLKDKVPGNK